ncbi:MAG TPA: GAF domain-containing protein [Thermoleophilaceae bacterium]|nr:GAF domain-containing protein [Thermoleophilaceae bacterium]
MALRPLAELDERIERRYVEFARLARSVATAADFNGLAAAVAAALEEPLDGSEPLAVRLWAITSDGVEELARHTRGRELPNIPQRALQRAAVVSEPSEAVAGRVLVGLHAGGTSLGVLEVDEDGADLELLASAAAMVACGVGLLAAQGIGDVLPSPVAVDGASDTASLMATFASEAKRLLDHDRLSAYLLTCEGRAFERFAVATSPIVPGEGVIIPFEDVGLRHVVVTNRPLVSSDLANDPRIVGREDRVIARAGFHGLISVPLRLGGHPFGVLNFVSRTAGFYDDHDVPIAQQVADQVSAFIGNLRAQQRMRTLIRHEAVESERARVARDVYHTVAQTVPAIERIAAALEQRLAGSDDAASEDARRVRELVRLELADVRRVVADLAPRGLDSQSLTEAIEATVAAFGEHDPKTTVSVEGDSSGLSDGVRRASYRIFQEAVTNARLHARAARIEVALRVDRDLLLRVSDDGEGFDIDEVGSGGGTGIPFMHERAQALGGMVTIESAPRRGTTVMFQLLGVRDAAESPRTPEEPVDRAASVPSILRVFVTEQHALTRSGLVALLEREDGMRVVGEAASVEETRGQIRRLYPNVLLVDAHLGEGELERMVGELKEAIPDCALLVLSDYETGREAEIIEAGASGVVPKTVTGDELTEAVRAVARGAKVTSFPTSGGEQGGVGLTSRERAVLALMTAGRTNAEIGATLFLATKTVERQVATITRKLGARNRAHAGAIAVARHLVEPGELEN